MRIGRQCRHVVAWLSTLEIPGIESDKPFMSSPAHKAQRHGRKRMGARVKPVESPESIHDGKFEHMAEEIPKKGHLLVGLNEAEKQQVNEES